MNYKKSKRYKNIREKQRKWTKLIRKLEKQRDKIRQDLRMCTEFHRQPFYKNASLLIDS